MTAVARTAQLVRGYGTVRALDGVDIEIGTGELCAVCGPNGSGKTTLLSILAGRLAPTSGEVDVLGVARPWALRGRAALALRARIGHAGQDLELDPEMTPRETLRFLAALHGAPVDRCDDLSRSLEIEPFEGRLVQKLSGGERRRLHLALALLGEPELVLLDEPTAGLDPDARTRLWRDLERRRDAGASIVVVTHDFEDVERCADRVVVLKDGRVQVEGPLREVVATDGTELVVAELMQPASEELVGALRAIDGVLDVEAERRELVVPLDADARPRVLELLAGFVHSVTVEPPGFRAFYRRTVGRERPVARRGRRRR